MSWKRRAPKRGPEREQMIADCGRACFLMPDERKFPICRKCRVGHRCTCLPECNGLRAAIMRGRQWGYNDVVQRAIAMRLHMNC